MLASNAVDRGFNLWSRQTKDYEIGICYFSSKYSALEDCLAPSQCDWVKTVWLRVRIMWLSEDCLAQSQCDWVKTVWLRIRIMWLSEVLCLPEDCLTQSQDNVTEWSAMSTCRLLFQGASSIKIQLHQNVTCSCHDIAEKLIIRI